VVFPNSGMGKSWSSVSMGVFAGCQVRPLLVTFPIFSFFFASIERTGTPCASAFLHSPLVVNLKKELLERQYVVLTGIVMRGIMTELTQGAP
jgi:hypothetical protein